MTNLPRSLVPVLAGSLLAVTVSAGCKRGGFDASVHELELVTRSIPLDPAITIDVPAGLELEQKPGKTHYARLTSPKVDGAAPGADLEVTVATYGGDGARLTDSRDFHEVVVDVQHKEFRSESDFFMGGVSKIDSVHMVRHFASADELRTPLYCNVSIRYRDDAASAATEPALKKKHVEFAKRICASMKKA